MSIQTEQESLKVSYLDTGLADGVMTVTVYLC